jgi:hypothetical protein
VVTAYVVVQVQVQVQVQVEEMVNEYDRTDLYLDSSRLLIHLLVRHAAYPPSQSIKSGQ